MPALSDFAWLNAVDNATFTAGSEAATLPSANLGTVRTGKVWRALATSSYFVATFAAATQIKVLALSGCTLASTDTVRHRLYDAGGGLLLDTGAIASGVVTGYGLHVYLLSSPLSPASWRCDISAPSRGSFGYFDILRAWAAPIFQPSVGISLPWEEAWNDDAANVRGKRSGNLFQGDGPKYRTLTVSLDFLSAAEKLQVKEMARVAGTRNQVLIIPDEQGSPATEAIIGRLDRVQPIRCSKSLVPPVYETTFNVIQDI